MHVCMYCVHFAVCNYIIVMCVYITMVWPTVQSGWLYGLYMYVVLPCEVQSWLYNSEKQKYKPLV